MTRSEVFSFLLTSGHFVCLTVSSQLLRFHHSYWQLHVRILSGDKMVPLTPASATFQSFAQAGLQHTFASPVSPEAADQSLPESPTKVPASPSQEEPEEPTDDFQQRPAARVFHSSPILSALHQRHTLTANVHSKGATVGTSEPTLFEASPPVAEQHHLELNKPHPVQGDAMTKATPDGVQSSHTDMNPVESSPTSRRQAGLRIRGLLTRRITS